MAKKLITQIEGPSPHQRAVRSTIALKCLMAITGLFLVFFLLFHMFGNFKLLMGANEYNHYAEFLREFLYPILPKKVFLWIFRVTLLLAAILHMWSAVKLTYRNFEERGSSRARYARQRYMEKSFAARTMIWGGIIIALFLVFHLLQFTAEVVTVGYQGSTTPYERVYHGFQMDHWWVLVVYTISMLAVCTHIFHGFFSAFCTLGANVGPLAKRILKACSVLIAVILFVGFMFPPFLIFFGVI